MFGHFLNNFFHHQKLYRYTPELRSIYSAYRRLEAMFSIHGLTVDAASRVIVYQQTRNLSRRKIAYPFYPFKRLGRQHPKEHDTNLKSSMRQFLGPRNYKGEYVMNKYFNVPNNHQPNYVKPDLERGQSLIHPITGETVIQKYDGSFGKVEENRRLRNVPAKRSFQPFPENRHCFTNHIISEDLKLRIYSEIQVEGLSTQQVSQNYGLKIPRVEAVVKLVEIEKKWEKYVCVQDDKLLRITMDNDEITIKFFFD